MQLLDIYADNLYSFKEMELDFTKYEKGTTIILGKNVSMDSSNGAGKSSILKSIFFALWGVDLNKVPLEGIVNDLNPDKGCLSRIRFKDDKNTYTITRFKNYKNTETPIRLKDGSVPKGSAVELLINDDVFYAPKDNNKIEKMVLGVLGMSPSIFLNSVLTGQKRTENFLSSPDSMKKELLSEILDLTQYDEAADYLSKEIKERRELINAKEIKLDEFRRFMEKTHEDVKELKVQAGTFTDELKLKVQSTQTDLSREQSKLKEMQSKELKEMDTKAHKNELEDISKRISINEKHLESFDAVREKLTNLNLLLEKSKSSKENKEKQVIELSEQNKELSETLKNKDKNQEELHSTNNKLKELENVSIKYNEVESTLSSVEKDLNELNVSLASKKGLLNECQSKINDTAKNLDKSKKDNACFTCERTFDTPNPLIIGLETKLKELSTNKDSLSTDIGSTEEKIASIKKKITDLKAEFSHFKTKMEERESLIVAKNNLQNKLDRIKEIEVQLSKNTDKILLFNTEVNKISETIVTINEEISKVSAVFNKLQEINQKQKQLLIKKDKLQSELHKMEKNNAEIKSYGDLLTAQTNAIISLEKRLEEIQSGKNPYIEMIMKKTKELRVYEESFNKMDTEVKELNDKFELLKFWEQGFSKNGIKSFIIDEVITLLNLKIKEYLKKLSGGNVSLFFEPEKVVKKHGTTKNEITTKIYINGKLKHPNSPSGGEEDRLTLAVDLALSDIAESRSGTKFNIKFLDEPFKWVDNKGQMKALALFNELSANRQGFFLISHDEKMQSFCNNTIYVINENGISRIVDKETFLNLK